ncbi:hypothetical protein J2754_001620 [Halarchaeum solikamskense]|uniref:hypothetical protein n=1 Tax=Halarchaeum nitratireducens TaxID=489913 RepID=UPI001B3B14F6|nr:hypothetical protein [Halarchaeum solikamskense]MBP2251299.1 hypothetical protein [Halarchaeum solikamskense]
MARDRVDYWSPIAALGAAVLLALLAFGRPTPPVTAALALGVVAFAAGVLLPVREALPSYERLLGVYLGVFGIAAFVSDGWSLTVAAMLLVGAVSLLELAYERVTGRSPTIA